MEGDCSPPLQEKTGSHSIMKQHTIYLSIILGAALFAFIQNFTLLFECISG